MSKTLSSVLLYEYMLSQDKLDRIWCSIMLSYLIAGVWTGFQQKFVQVATLALLCTYYILRQQIVTGFDVTTLLLQLSLFFSVLNYQVYIYMNAQKKSRK